MPIESGHTPRNLIILCDGTNNEVKKNLSNVLKLFRMTTKTEEQRVFYDPGIGTIADDTPWARLRQKSTAIFALATGYGLDDNLARIYAWVSENWRPDDRIWLFGFSRGAYTVRALAGLIHMIGIARADQANLAGYCVKAYRQMSETGDFEITDHFRKVVGARRAPIHFMGVWDTVASITVPGWRKLLLVMLEHLPYTRRNPSVRHFRQALAIDERRRLFRPRIWADPQDHVPNPFDTDQNQPQSIKQMWFAGCHADIGGGNAEEVSGLSKYPLIWMAEEAIAEGLDIRTQTLNRIARGQPRENEAPTYTKPSPAAPINESLTWGWKPFEILPKSSKRLEFRSKRSLAGYYLPLGEPRNIPDQALIHTSVQTRIQTDSSYAPPNIPSSAVYSDN